MLSISVCISTLVLSSLHVPGVDKNVIARLRVQLQCYGQGSYPWGRLQFFW